MHPLRRSILALILAVVPTMAAAQARVDRPVSSYGTLQRPDLVPGISQIRPHFEASAPAWAPAYVPPTVGANPYYAPSGKTLVNPVVSDDTVAIFNASSTTLKFTLAVNSDPPKVIEISSHQIYFDRHPRGTKLSGTITTGSSSSSMSFSLGTIYVLRALGTKWTFAKF